MTSLFVCVFVFSIAWVGLLYNFALPFTGMLAQRSREHHRRRETLDAAFEGYRELGPLFSKAVRERRILSLRILSWSVERLTPRRAAAPFGPETTPFVSCSARRI